MILVAITTPQQQHSTFNNNDDDATTITSDWLRSHTNIERVSELTAYYAGAIMERLPAASLRSTHSLKNFSPPNGILTNEPSDRWLLANQLRQFGCRNIDLTHITSVRTSASGNITITITIIIIIMSSQLGSGIFYHTQTRTHGRNLQTSSGIGSKWCRKR